MSRDPRTNFYRDRARDRERDRDRERNRERDREYRYEKGRQKWSPHRDLEKRRSRSPRIKEKDLDENILSEISKLPEPSELWDTQFQEPGFSGQPPSFPPEASNYGSAPNYQPPYSSGIYDDFPPVASVPQGQPPEMAAWNQMSLPPPPVPSTVFVNNVDDQMKKEAIETEMRHQKAALSKQREDYIKKAAILKKELDTLKDQRNELRGDPKRSPSPDTKRFLKENTKLQLEIQNKLKTINNVVDMLNGIIGEEAQEPVDTDDTSDQRSKRKSRSPTNKKFNYVYYDPEMHWCRVCNEFPPTAKDYLNHLHSPAHHKMAAAHMEAPWHTVSGVNEGFPSFPSAPTKRTPIRGLQFFVPSTAWYCKLCDQFIGDLHCASAHLKSVVHSKNYTNFVEQNPHWETDWMSDRQKAFEKARANNKLKQEEKNHYTAHTITFSEDGFQTKLKEPPAEEKKKEKKKKKKRKRSSSSSSSSSNSSDSEPVKKKKSKKDKVKLEPDDKSLTEWMSSIQMNTLTEHDRKLLDTFKHRIKFEKKEEQRRSTERSSTDRQRKRNSSREPERHERRSPSARRERRPERRDTRDARDERRDAREERRDARDERRDSPSRTSPRQDKKPDIRKMPFIGKMPVYKNLNKVKNEEQKKDDQKKKEEEEAAKKRREVMDAEIQKKVAEFKEKIAKAQLERAAGELPPPAVAIPTALGAPPHFLPPPAHPAALPPPAALPQPLPPQPQPQPQPPPPAQPPAAPPTPALPKDFQDALDIIFPPEVKKAANDILQSQGELFGMPPGMSPFPLGMPPFGQPLGQPLGQVSILGQPPPMMMPFDLNNPLFNHRPQLYDTHVPLVPNQKRNNNYRNKNMQKHQNKNQSNQQKTEVKKEAEEKEKTAAAEGAAKKKEEMDDLAMLGIDASDVGAGM